MKIHPISLITSFLFVSFFSAAQDDFRYRLRLQSGDFIPAKNITAEGIADFNRSVKKINGISFVILQFETIPTTEQRKQLQQAGIELLDYIPANAYTATVTGEPDLSVLQQVKARAIAEPAPKQKMQRSLSSGNLPDYAVKSPGTIDVWISFPKTFSFAEVSEELRKRNFEINHSLLKDQHIIGLRVPQQRLNELASLPIIEYVQPAPGEDQPLNNKSTVNARANVIASSLGRDLTGDDVVIGVGDDANPLRHIDFAGRMINRNIASGGGHGLHVMGIAAGAGIVVEKWAGYAPKATIVAQTFSNILINAPAYVQDYGMVISNNSYGNIVNECDNFGVYDLYSRFLDQQAAQLPHLQTVFAAGNSGRSICGNYVPTFGNVLGGYQSAKNVISVGNTTENDSIHYVSSKGPVKDGRIKPEITAQGRLVVSSWPVNIYSFNTGTSMSAPAVAGGLALLYQYYRRLNGGNDPKAGLMKALLCNGATDLGNPGPDYTYGFGWMNLLRSAIMLEKNNFYTGQIATGNNDDYIITVPANTAQLKVMLYWNDTAASVLASQTLVNDLDLEVIDNSSNTHLPYLLDTVPGNVNQPAGTGADHVNNIEQVVIFNPPAGNYTLRVKGTAVNQNPTQEYFLVYDTIPVSTTLTYPIGGERLHPNDSIYISWDSWGDPANTFNLEYSNNNGSSWSPVPGGTNVSDTLRQLKWFIPSGTAADTSDQYLVRITRNGTGMVSTSQPFTVLGPASVSLAPTSDQCEGYIAIKWNRVIKATDYEVMILRGDAYEPVAAITDTSYTFSGLSKDSVYWVTVRPRLNGNPGRRADAVSRQPNNGDCTGSISDNDLKIDAILSPAKAGRKFTLSELTNSELVTIRIKNLDDAASNSNLDVKYYINGVHQQTQTISPSIAGGGTYDHTFSLAADFSAVGADTLQVVVKKTGDPVVVNDSTFQVVKQLDNPPLLTGDLPWKDDLETAGIHEVTGSHMGIAGRDRYDFISTTAYGRIRTFTNSGMAYSGSKALTLDTDRYHAAGNTDSLIATFNMINFDANTDNLRLDFRYKNHGQGAHAAHKVWIRGSETDNWIEVYDLYTNQNGTDGSYKLAAGIDISDSLDAYGQNYSTSFQVKWGQWGQFIAADNDGRDGYTFDDIRLYSVTDDIQLISIDTPVAASCNLNATVPVKVTVYNSANSTVNNIPIVLKKGGSTIATENISSIAAKTPVQYTFAATVDLSVLGSHDLEVYVALATDSYKENDTARLTLVNSSVISSFPYLQDFESGNGSWYTGGLNSSWEYGTPAAIKINKAASGTKAWKTSIAGFYNDKEYSYLYSPCFDLTGMASPTLSFNTAIDIEDCGASVLCDAAWVEYSLDGETWSKLGAVGDGTNWYNRNYSGFAVWSRQNYTRWHVATVPLPATNNNRLRLRFAFYSDQVLSREGIAIDDIHIYDNTMGIYTGPPSTSNSINQPIVNGSNWVHFTDGGKLVASINPNGQDLGSTNAQAFIHTGTVRNNGSQYYHNRNITIKPTHNSLGGPATVRFYFLDTETDSLILASGCGACTKPTWVGELGVSKYSDPNDAVEDGDLANSLGSYWSFIEAANVKKIPFDKGYYAEFDVTNFSEFWLNDGWINKTTPLPVQLMDFTATKTANKKDVLAKWTTASEINVNRFEIELAKGNDGLSQNRFVKIGEVISQGNSTSMQHYSFVDEELGKTGARYYRLKIVDNDGSFAYSPIRSVLFSDEVKWQVFPNPSSAAFNFVYQLNSGEMMNVKLYDAAGRVVYQNTATGSGFLQKLTIDLSAGFSNGLYLLEAASGDRKETYRLIKN